MSEGFVEITTRSAKKRHLAVDNEAARQLHYGVMRAEALCSPSPGWTEGGDQESTDRERAKYHLKAVVIADLPMCKRCERIAAKRETEGSAR